jgi:hypothetical protein
MSHLPRDKYDRIKLSNYSELTEQLRLIRNEIAHNGMFWAVYAPQQAACFKVQEVFAFILEALIAEGQRDVALAIVSMLRTLMRKENYALLDERAKTDQQPHKVRHWTAQKQQQAGQPHMECDKRPAIRREVGKWMRALNQASQQTGLERPKKVA